MGPCSFIIIEGKVSLSTAVAPLVSCNLGAKVFSLRDWSGGEFFSNSPLGKTPLVGRGTVESSLGAPGAPQSLRMGDIWRALNDSLGSPTFTDSDSVTTGRVFGELEGTLDWKLVEVIDLVSFRRRSGTGDISAIKDLV